MNGTVLQVSISRGGVPKRAIPEGDIGPLGIAGDGYAHPQIHGGPKQAVLLIASEAIDELTALGYPLYPGALGENITTLGVDRARWRAGQRWRVGQAVIELTKVRAPCETLSVYGAGIQKAVYDAQVKAGDPSSPRWALAGFYASVVQTGIVRRGDPISLLDQMV
ncbi:MAG TPA: MOSC domain-containing protein [Bryobacteraceae bacterium]|jgi:MOSC domain-containing protein YiiM|nr:MOSC domain-containing protein [Bryobacteraceae bacterium]